MKFSIFSHTPMATTKNSQELHRADFDGDPEGKVADIVGQELARRGHKIVEIRPSKLNDGQARHRRNRHH